MKSEEGLFSQPSSHTPPTACHSPFAAMVSAMSPLLHPRAWLHPRVWWVSGDHSELLRSLAVGCVFMVVGLLVREK